jgi:hypothetical protein
VRLVSLNFTGFIVALPTVLDIYVRFIVLGSVLFGAVLSGVVLAIAGAGLFGYCIDYIRNVNPICSGSGREYPTIATFNCERTNHIFRTLAIPTL